MVFDSTAAAEEILAAIKNDEYTNSATVYGLLQQIINDCSGTAVAKEAQIMLDERF